MKENLLISLKTRDIWGFSLSETIQVNDWSPSRVLLNSDGHQVWNNGEEQNEGLSFTHCMALGKYLGVTSPSALQANPSYHSGLLWELKAGT